MVKYPCMSCPNATCQSQLCTTFRTWINSKIKEIDDITYQSYMIKEELHPFNPFSLSVREIEIAKKYLRRYKDKSGLGYAYYTTKENLWIYILKSKVIVPIRLYK